MNIWGYLRQCLVCSDYKFKVTHMLCDSCKFELYQLSQKSPNPLCLNHDFTAFSWCYWTQENDDLIRPIIYGLKGGLLKQAIFEICSEVSFSLNEIFKNKPLLLPAPARPSNQTDHAYQIALAFSEIYDLQIIKAFERIYPDDLQKTKTKNQRKTTNLKLSTNLSTQEIDIIKNSYRPLLFIDDLITTGSTANHAYNALKKNHRFIAFSIFYKVLMNY